MTLRLLWLLASLAPGLPLILRLLWLLAPLALWLLRRRRPWRQNPLPILILPLRQCLPSCPGLTQRCSQPLHLGAERYAVGGDSDLDGGRAGPRDRSS